MIKKLVKPEQVENSYVVPFREAIQKEAVIDDGGGSGCSGQRTYADEEIDDISF